MSEFTYTDQEFNAEFIAFMEECIQVMRERSQEYNNSAESTSMLKYFSPDAIVDNHFVKCYVFVQQKYDRFVSCLQRYIRKVSLGSDATDSYTKAEDSIRDLINYAAFEAVILRLHQRWIASQQCANAVDAAKVEQYEPSRNNVFENVSSRS